MITLFLALAALVPQQVPETSALQRDLAFLSADERGGRFPGTEGCRQAARYIETALREAGLRPAFGDSYRQPFTFIGGMEEGPGTRLVLSVDGVEHTIRNGEDVRPAAISASAFVEGRLVFASFGITESSGGRDDYRDIDVDGAVVLALRGAPEDAESGDLDESFRTLRYKAFNAKNHGASGLILVSPPGSEDDLAPSRHDFSFSDAGIPVLLAAGNRVAAVLAGGSKSPFRSAWSERRSADLPGTRARIVADLERKEVAAANIGAILPGDGNGVVVLAAHYDHLGLGEFNSIDEEPGQVHNGADDNASGVALLLDLARRFSCMPPLPFDLLFLFPSAEEEGTLGSSYFVNHPPIPKNAIRFMINADMVGNLHEGKVIVQGVGSSPDWMTLIPSVMRGNDTDAAIQYAGFGASDHSSFYAEGIPVLFFFTGTHNRYHSSRDDVEWLDIEGITTVRAAVEDVILAASSLPSPPRFQQVPEELVERRAGRGYLKVYLGTIPDFSSTDGLFRLQGVRAGGPADRSGLRKGDVILKFGDFSVRDIYDYTFALKNYRPGDTVEVVILRQGVKLTTSVTLEKKR